MQIVIAADSAYETPLHACLASVVEHDPGANIQLLDCGLHAAQRDALERTIGDNGRLTFTPVSPSRFQNLPRPICGSTATYARLVLDELLSVDRLLYLDADTLVTRPLRPLAALDLEGHPLAAVREMYTPVVSAENGVREWEALGLRADTPYFNAGVLLIDLPRWEHLRISATALEYLERSDVPINLFDQEALNVALAGNWLELPVAWNVSRYWYKPHRRVPPNDAILEEARVLHFLSEDKPWLERSGVPPAQIEAFYRAIDRSAISGWRPGGG